MDCWIQLIGRTLETPAVFLNTEHTKCGDPGKTSVGHDNRVLVRSSSCCAAQSAGDYPVSMAMDMAGNTLHGGGDPNLRVTMTVVAFNRRIPS